MLYDFFFFFFNDTATTEIYTLSLHDALPIYLLRSGRRAAGVDRLHHRPKNLRAIYAAQARIRGAIRMRHQAEDISLPVADASNVFNRTIRIRFGNNPAFAVRITQNHLRIGVKVAQSFRVREETTFTMCNRHPEKRSFWTVMCER